MYAKLLKVGLYKRKQMKLECKNMYSESTNLGHAHLDDCEIVKPSQLMRQKDLTAPRYDPCSSSGHDPVSTPNMQITFT